MQPAARWRIIDGRPFVEMTLPGRFRIALPQYYAWHLKNALERVLATAPPRPDDNGQCEH